MNFAAFVMVIYLTAMDGSMIVGEWPVPFRSTADMTAQVACERARPVIEERMSRAASHYRVRTECVYDIEY